MPSKHVLKRYFITAIITSLVISALIGIFVILLGSFGSIQARILLSTLAIGVFSITSLANLRNLESGHPSYRRFAWLSITFSLIAILLTLSLIWISVEQGPWKPTLVFIILAVSTAHASLLLPSRTRSTLLDTAVTATLACITFVAGFLVYLIIVGGDVVGDFFYRLLGVFAILDVLGTIVTPILARITPKTPAQPPSNTLRPPISNSGAPTSTNGPAE
jgi:uncharacterized membrane protein YfcA